MLEYLNEKKAKLIEERNLLANTSNDELIAIQVKEFEDKLRAEFQENKEQQIAALNNKIAVIDEFIVEQEEEIAKQTEEEALVEAEVEKEEINEDAIAETETDNEVSEVEASENEEI